MDERPNYLDVDKDGSNDIAKNFTQSDVELIERDQVPSIFPGHRFGDIDRHSSSFQAHTKTQDDTTSDHHTEIDGTCFQSRTNSVENEGDDNSHSAAYCFVRGTKEQCTANCSEGYTGSHEGDL